MAERLFTTRDLDPVQMLEDLEALKAETKHLGCELGWTELAHGAELSYIDGGDDSGGLLVEFDLSSEQPFVTLHAHDDPEYRTHGVELALATDLVGETANSLLIAMARAFAQGDYCLIIDEDEVIELAVRTEDNKYDTYLLYYDLRPQVANPLAYCVSKPTSRTVQGYQTVKLGSMEAGGLYRALKNRVVALDFSTPLGPMRVEEVGPSSWIASRLSYEPDAL